MDGALSLRIKAQLSENFNTWDLSLAYITSLKFYPDPLSPVYTIQPVVKPIAKPDWQPVERTVAVRSTRLNEQWLFIQHGCQTGFDNNRVWQPVWQPGWMFVYTIQPVVKPVVQPVWQPAVSCKQGITVCLSYSRKADFDQIRNE